MLDLPTDNQCVAVARPLEPRALTVRQEAFAQRFAACGNAAKAYRQAYHVGPNTLSGTVRNRAFELVHRPEVAERVRQLQAAAAEGTTVSVRGRMVWLQSILEADVREMIRVVAEPCPECWKAAEPALSTPREDCPICAGHGVSRVHVEPSEHWSAAARALVRGIRQKANGELEIRLHSQLEACDLLNRMQGVYVDRSVTLTATVAVPALDKMTREEQLAFLESLKPVRE
jgi:hypothetical protein